MLNALLVYQEMCSCLYKNLLAELDIFWGQVGFFFLLSKLFIFFLTIAYSVSEMLHCSYVTSGLCLVSFRGCNGTFIDLPV